MAALGLAELRSLVTRLGDVFAAHREELDDLNVFPVPDGDTGTNLLNTARTIAQEIEGTPDDELPAKVARGAMMGARGNSGIILSQLLRGLTETLDEAGSLDVDGLARALKRGCDLAYDAVREPVEGTILTAIRAAAESAEDVAGRDAELIEVAEEVLTDVHEAVEHTTEQLEALHEAGVVDAGARGFEVFCAAFRDVVAGHEGETVDEEPEPVVERTGSDVVTERESGSIEYRFEVQYLLDADSSDAPALRERLEELGDSVVVVAAGHLMNVHVHTNDIGAALEAGLDLGRPSRVEVTYFADQFAARERCDAPEAVAVAPEGRVRIACVVVLSGEGLRDLAREHGAEFVAGGAGDLPAVSELLNAIRSHVTHRILVLPGHRNVVPAAEQAAEIARREHGRSIDVVRTATSIPAVLAALTVYDPDGDPDDVHAAMAEAAGACAAGEVVRATRDADTPIGHVERGQPLASVNGEVVATAGSPVEALLAVAEELDVADAEAVTLVVGSGVDGEDRDAAVDALEQLSQASLEVVDGGQRPAIFVLGVE